MFGLEVLRVAQADVLPLDYEAYADAIARAVAQAEKRAGKEFGGNAPNFAELDRAVQHYKCAASNLGQAIASSASDVRALNETLLEAERALLAPAGLPGRPWYKHVIYAPAEFSSYSATALPGINDAITQHDRELTASQIKALTVVLDSAAAKLDAGATPPLAGR